MFPARILVLLWAVAVNHVTSRLMREVCENAEPQTTYPNAPSMPVIPDTFEVHVHCKISNRNQSTEVTEYYDYDNNRGVMHQVELGTRFYIYYDYNTDEMMNVFPDDKTCYRDKLGTDPNRFLFGYKPSHGHAHIFTPSAALHFGFDNLISSYQGPGVVRGIRVHTWYSCQYVAEFDATVNVYWSFTDPLNWDTAVGYPDTPAQCRVTGVAKNSRDNGTHTFDHTYDFLHFKNFISSYDSDVFETPDGVVCSDRINTKPLPSLPDTFSMTVEVVNKLNRQVSFLQEWYDKDLNLVKFKYVPGPYKSLLFGTRPLTEVHDFGAGVAYIMDELLGNCSVIPIEHGGFDDELQDPSHVRIRTAAEFFYLDNVQVAYQGQRTVRGIPADSWVANRPNFPPGSNMNGVWQWFFQADNWTSTVEKQASYTGGTPIQMRFLLEESAYDYNLFHFQPKLDSSAFDVTSCYTNKRRRNFDFAFSGQYQDDIRGNLTEFTHSLLATLRDVTKLSPLRISVTRVVFLADVHVRVELLDKAPITGDVSQMRAQTDLDSAAAALLQAIHGNGFVVNIGPNSQEQIAALPQSVVERTVAPPNVVTTTRPSPTRAPPPRGTTRGPSPGTQTRSSASGDNSQTYSPGDMGGLGVGTLILGALLGSGSAFVYMRRRLPHIAVN
ncbi:hypothetical protein BaRGS_00010889 [Batillaria attramentaria]|uniref:Uncharacterized protein n=1 Tax=Batillaria attramentaria TaxID=370345 RepID=A0ABD0LEJ1_9CAEN